MLTLCTEFSNLGGTSLRVLPQMQDNREAQQALSQQASMQLQKSLVTSQARLCWPEGGTPSLTCFCHFSFKPLSLQRVLSIAFYLIQVFAAVQNGHKTSVSSQDGTSSIKTTSKKKKKKLKLGFYLKLVLRKHL